MHRTTINLSEPVLEQAKIKARRGGCGPTGIRTPTWLPAGPGCPSAARNWLMPAWMLDTLALIDYDCGRPGRA
jgi:hypothetical protein